MRNKGFTVIEFLIYIIILSIVIAAILSVSINVFQVGARTNAVQEVAHNGRFSLHTIGRFIKSADQIISPQTEGNFLELKINERPIVIFVENGKLMIREGEKTTELTTSKVTVNRLFFKKINPDSIKIEMDISFFNPHEVREYEFNNFFTTSYTLR